MIKDEALQMAIDAMTLGNVSMDEAINACKEALNPQPKEAQQRYTQLVIDKAFNTDLTPNGMPLISKGKRK